MTVLAATATSVLLARLEGMSARRMLPSSPYIVSKSRLTASAYCDMLILP